MPNGEANRLANSRRIAHQVARLIEIALQLEGLPRHASTHAAGVVIGTQPLIEMVPLYRDPKSGDVMTQFDMRCVEKVGLIKFDFLGLKTLTVIADAEKLIGAEHPGFTMSAWEIMEATLRKSGMWDAQTNFDRGGQDFSRPFETMHFLDGFDTPDRKFHFSPDWKRFGGRWGEMPVLPDHLDVIDNATKEKPFRLVAAPARTFLNSTFTETPTSTQISGTFTFQQFKIGRAHV